MLKQGIYQMLDDPLNAQYGALIYNHPMVSSMTNGENGRPPQYMSSTMFSQALIDVIGQQAEIELKVKRKFEDGESGSVSFETTTKKAEVEANNALSALELFGAGIDEMNASPLREVFRSFHSQAGGDVEKLKKLIQEWYENQMDRVSGWYKTSQKKKYYAFGLIVAIALNVDSIYLFNSVNLNADLRDKLVNYADGFAGELEKLTKEERESTENQIKALKSIGLVDSIKDKEQIIAEHNQYLLALDSAEQDLTAKVIMVNSALNELGVPIGWDRKHAPLSWLPCKKKNKCKDDKVELPDKLIDYHHKRNSKFSWKYLIFYFIGVWLTAKCLSFGAPFWFDALMKLVNIRRSGNKPKNTAS